MPIPFLRRSEFLKKEIGFNSFANNSYFNIDLSPDHEKNKEGIDTILKLEVSKNFKFIYGFLNFNLFYFAKASLIHAIYDVDNAENSDTRIGNLKKSETILRTVLKRLSFEEELAYLKNIYNTLEIKLRLSNQNPTDKIQFDAKKQEIYALMTQNMIEVTEQDMHFNMRDTPMTSPETREERMLMMCRIRYLSHLINSSLSFYSRSYYILRDAILNIKRYSDDMRNIELGEEKENQIDVKIEEPKDSKKKPAPPAEKDNKKDAKKGVKDVTVASEEVERKVTEEKKKKMEEEIRFYKLQAGERKTRNMNNGYWWIKLRTEYTLLLLRENKLDDCEMILTTVKEDCKALNDTFFSRILNEIYGKILIKRGKIENGMQVLKGAIVQGETYYHDDASFGKLLGDFGDLLYNNGKVTEAEIYYMKANNVLKKSLLEVKYEFKSQNINDKPAEEHIKLTSSLFIPLEVEANIIKPERFKSKKEEKKGLKDDPNKGKKADPKARTKNEAEAITDQKIDVFYPLSKEIDFSKENKHNFLELDDKLAQTVSSKLPANYYCKNIENYIRSILNYLRCILQYDNLKDENIILNNIEEIEKIIENQFNLLLSFRFHFYLLCGKYYYKKFTIEVLKIHTEYENKYLQKNVKKYRKLHERTPFRDLPRNKFLSDIPNFSKDLKEIYIPYLEKSKGYLEKCLKQMRGECLILENDLKVEEAFYEMAKVCLALREYRPRPSYKYYLAKDLEKITSEHKIIWKKENAKPYDMDEFERLLEINIKEDQKICSDLEW